MENVYINGMKPIFVISGFILLFAGCSFYHEATKKKDEDKLKSTLMSLQDLQNKAQSLQSLAESFAMIEFFQNSGALPDECTPPESDPSWAIPEKCQAFIPDECPEGTDTWEELEACGGYHEGGLFTELPDECQYEDASETIPDSCKTYIDSGCQSSVTWAEAQQCIADQLGNLPDTSQDPNPINDYPGNTPVEGDLSKGTCFFDTDAAVTGSRDWCCYDMLQTGCVAVWKFYDSGEEKTYTPVFNVDTNSSADSCKSQGFVYCDPNMQCCYN